MLNKQLHFSKNLRICFVCFSTLLLKVFNNSIFLSQPRFLIQSLHSTNIIKFNVIEISRIESVSVISKISNFSNILNHNKTGIRHFAILPSI